MRNVALVGVVGLFLAGSWGCGSSPMMAAESAPADPGGYARADVASEDAAPPPQAAPATAGAPAMAGGAEKSAAFSGKAPPVVAREFNGVRRVSGTTTPTTATSWPTSRSKRSSASTVSM